MLARGVGVAPSRIDADLLTPTVAAPPGDIAIAPPPEQFDGPAPPPAPRPRALNSGRFSRVTPTGGTWAVMIGVNDYPGSKHDLRSAVADAADVDLALSRMGVPADHRLVLTDGQASADVIELAADWLVAHAGPDAVAVFFFAGHIKKLSSGTEAMVGSDGKNVTDATLAERLRGLQARRAWISLAACFGGGFTETLAPGRVLSAAAGANSLAYENASFGRSYMVQFMIREAFIDNRAPGSVQDAFVYARDSIARDYPGREPVQFDSGSAPLSLRPAGSGPAPRPQPKPAPPPQEPAPAPGSGSGSGGSSGGGSSSGGSGTQPGECKDLQLGVITCRDGA